jgi:ArsR family transcriptional regulator
MEELVGVMCKALNDPKRLLILSLLGEKPRTVGELVGIIGSPQANISQHLAILRDRGIIEANKEGTSVKYSLRHPKLLEAIGILREVLHDEVERRGNLVGQI